MEFSPTTLTHIRATIRKEAQKELEKLREDRFEFNWQYVQRIKEIEWIIEQQHKLYVHPKATFSSKYKYLQELKDLTVLLNNFYDMLPILGSNSIRMASFLTMISFNPIIVRYKLGVAALEKYRKFIFQS